ncbi:MAG: tRNA (N6-isopentenyl adenosine(37)-C2)-methylthiotransferase MiaB [Patescibacteria group bacterium]
MKYFIITYGCQMQKSDSERIVAELEKNNYQSASRISEADLILVNMCSVRQSAVDRVYGLAEKFKIFKRERERLKTLLTGCVLPLDFERSKKIFDYVLSIKSLPRWHSLLKKRKYFLMSGDRESKSVKMKIDYLRRRPKYSNKFSALITISSGCDNFCTYCAVPYTRGPLICRPHQEILREAKNAISNGFSEIWLLGQNVNDYQSPTDSSINFSKTLKLVNKIPGKFWIRFTSPHPKNFSGELIKTMAQCQKLTPYLNLPVQSGDNNVLKRMNRPYAVKHYKDLVKKIRNAFKKQRKGMEKEIALSTDVIVGFPGETKKEFENTARLFREIGYDMAYIAKYSPRTGTKSAILKDSVKPEEKEGRYKVLNELLKESALKRNKKYLGKTLGVLVEKIKDDFLIGKSRHYKTVKIKAIKSRRQRTENKKRQGEKIGRFVEAKIVGVSSWGLNGVLKR